MRANGLKVRNKGKEKSPLKVAVFLRVTSKMTRNMVMERCIIILQETISKESGLMMWSVGWELWTGQTYAKNMLVNGKITNKKVGVCIYGCNLRVKENTWEIDTKVTGKTESVMDMAYFIMQTDRNTKVIGKITWKKAIPFILMKMEKFH